MTFISVPEAWRDPDIETVRRLARGINQLADGRSRAIGSVDIDSGSTSTDVVDPRVGTDSVISFMATTSAGAVIKQTLRVSARGKGTFTISYTIAASDATLEYAIQG